MIDVVSNSQDCRGAIETVVGQAYLRDASADDAIDGVQPRWVVEPGSADEVGGVLRLANACGLKVIPRGGGTKIDWGNPPRGADVVLSTTRLNRVLEHAFGDMTATVQAGCAVDEFNRHLSIHGQRLAVDPLWPQRATIGGSLAANDNGALRAAFGGLRDCLIGITVALPDGAIAKSGGRVVKNVAGFDLPKLFTGSFGTLGVIVEATFRLYPCPKASRRIGLVVSDSEKLGGVLAAINGISALTSCVQIEARLDTPTLIHVGVEGLIDAIDGKVQRIMKAALGAGGMHEDTQVDLSANRETLFSEVDSCVSKISLLPTEWPGFLKTVHATLAPAGLRWSIVGQAMGVGLLAVKGSNCDQLSEALVSLRDHLGRSQASLVVLRGCRDVKNRIGAWPKSDSALPLMRRIKEQFDPNNTLSPGRFIGGI